VASVKVESVGCFGVENKADGPCSLLLFLPHLSRNVITVSEFV
jgi:hypothetical protein